MLKKIFLISVLSISGCSTYTPVVDVNNTDTSKYAIDMQECKDIANKAVSVADKAGLGVAATAAGAGIGGAVGGGQGMATGAGIGAVTGILGAWATYNRVYKNTYRNCMIYRGYKVLN